MLSTFNVKKRQVHDKIVLIKAYTLQCKLPRHRHSQDFIMPKLIALFTLLFSLANAAHAQSNIHFTSTEGVENEDLMNVLRFQDIHLAKVKLNGNHLWGKDFKIFIRDFQNGKLHASHQVFDSREDEFFKIKEEELSFSVLAQRTQHQSVKIDIRFLGFGISKEIAVSADQKDFALKSFQGAQQSLTAPIGKTFPLLSFLMPYRGKNGASYYCDVVQSGVAPEELGKKFKLPRYFLIEMQLD